MWQGRELDLNQLIEERAQAFARSQNPERRVEDVLALGRQKQIRRPTRPASGNCCGSRAGMSKAAPPPWRRKWSSEEHTSELQSLMRISYAVFCLNKKNKYN